MSLPTPEGDTTVLVVDDHELIRQGLVGAFGREPGMTVVGEAATVTEALKVYQEQGPQVVVTDLQLPDGTGLDIIRAIRRDNQQAGLVVVTMHSGDDQIFAAMEAGASAFVGKDAPSAEVVKAAKHAVVSPRSFLCAGLVGAMMRRASAESTRLSDREHQVLVLLADGLGAGQIAQQLYLSESTAKSHIARIYQKLGASNRAQALVTAMRIGLLSSLPSRDLARLGALERLGGLRTVRPASFGVFLRRQVRPGNHSPKGLLDIERSPDEVEAPIREDFSPEAPGLLGTHIPFHTGDKEMLDYLRIMLNARLAKMDERGASAVEYGLLVAGIAAVIVAIVFVLGGNLQGAFSNTNASIAGSN